MRSMIIVLVFGSFACGIASVNAVVFPIQLEGVDSSTQSTINQLFIEDFGLMSGTKVVAPPESLACMDRESAIDAARSMKQEEAVYVSARKLGSKWIVRGTVTRS